jgi:hypothetical protein
VSWWPLACSKSGSIRAMAAAKFAATAATTSAACAAGMIRSNSVASAARRRTDWRMTELLQGWRSWSKIEVQTGADPLPWR